jgi:hypothetical protein
MAGERHSGVECQRPLREGGRATGATRPSGRDDPAPASRHLARGLPGNQRILRGTSAQTGAGRPRLPLLKRELRSSPDSPAVRRSRALGSQMSGSHFCSHSHRGQKPGESARTSKPSVYSVFQDAGGGTRTPDTRLRSPQAAGARACVQYPGAWLQGVARATPWWDGWRDGAWEQRAPSRAAHPSESEPTRGYVLAIARPARSPPLVAQRAPAPGLAVRRSAWARRARRSSLLRGKR